MPQCKRIELSGRRFGWWTVMEPCRSHNLRHLYYRCRCECGAEKLVRGETLRNGSSTNCGCAFVSPIFRHGQSWDREKHLPTSEYAAWNTMKQRCENPRLKNFKYYGARGISVCDRWRNSFDDFFADMGPKPTPEHSLDREDNDGDYEPGNCQWATRIEQRHNRRDSRRGVDCASAGARSLSFNLALPLEAELSGGDIDAA